MEVYITSGTHVDRDIQERINAVEAALDDPEHVFVEGDRSNFSPQALRGLGALLALAPPLGLAVVVQIYVLIELGGRLLSAVGKGAGGRDADIVAELKARHNIESEEVDPGPAPVFFDNWGWFTVTNWVATFIIFWLFWPIQLHPWSLILPLAWMVLVGYCCFIILLGVANPFRNNAMANAIRNHRDNFEEVCFVTGEAHHAAVGRLLNEDPDVAVLNPVPDDPGVTTRLSVAALRLFE